MEAIFLDNASCVFRRSRSIPLMIELIIAKHLAIVLTNFLRSVLMLIFSK